MDKIDFMNVTFDATFLYYTIGLLFWGVNYYFFLKFIA